METADNKPSSNPFKALEGNESVPEGLKQKVMTSVNFSNMLLDITELFTSNMASSVETLFKTSLPDKKDKYSDEDKKKDERN